MSEKYKVPLNTKLSHPAHAQHAHAQRVTQGSQMNKVTDTVLDVTKVAVTTGAAIGIMGAAGALLKK
jgi:hypothetical protein